MARKKNDENGVALQEVPQGEIPLAEPVAEATPPAEEKKRPVMKFGPYAVDKGTNVQVAVWDREIELQGGTVITVYNCTVQCSYLDKEGRWINTPFFRGAALPIISHALMKAYDWILEARNQSRENIPF